MQHVTNCNVSSLCQYLISVLRPSRLFRCMFAYTTSLYRVAMSVTLITVQNTIKQKTDIYSSCLIAVPFDCHCTELRTSSLQLMTRMNHLPWVRRQNRYIRIQHGRLLLELMRMRQDVSVSHQYWSLLSSHCARVTLSKVWSSSLTAVCSTSWYEKRIVAYYTTVTSFPVECKFQQLLKYSLHMG